MSQFALVAAQATSNFGAGVLVIVLIVLAIVAYWVPTIIAVLRYKQIPNPVGVIVVNIFLGWTFIGWVVALVMAVRSKPQPVTYAQPPYPGNWPPGGPPWHDPQQPRP